MFKECLTIAAAVCLLLVQAGCRSAPTKAVDAELRRHAAWGATAYTEGTLDEAEKEYRAALKRAWLLDDPLEIGKAAENLALCFSAKECWGTARDWLVEARLELSRAGESTAPTWLIESQIDRACGNVELAESHAKTAMCNYCKALSEDEFPCLPCLCRESKEREPKLCVVRCRKERREAQANFEVQAAIVQAELAIDRGECRKARELLQRAGAWREDSADDELGPAMLHVLGRLTVAENRPLAAARYFDREAEALRQVESYLGITTAREAAAAAYDMAGRGDLAADRLYRAARMWFARGEKAKALSEAQLAAEIGANSGDSSTPIRAALLVQWIAQESPPRRTRKTRPSESAADQQQRSDPAPLPPTANTPEAVPSPPAAEPGSAAEADSAA